MRRALRVVAVVGLWAGASFFGPAAEAHHSINFTPCSSQATPTPSGQPSPTTTPTTAPTPTSSSTPQNCVPGTDARIVGNQVLQFSVEANDQNPIQCVDLFILSEEELPNPGTGSPACDLPANPKPVHSWSFANRDQAPATQTFSFNWDSVTLTPHNGLYKVLVVAGTHRGAADPHAQQSNSLTSRTQRSLRVDNPPKAVAAPRIVATTPTTVSLEWDKAAEPDVLEYKLYRANSTAADKVPAQGDFKLVGTSTEPKKVDEVRGQEFYYYGVVVTRRSVVTQGGINSPMSPISKAAEVKAVEEKPAGGGDAPKPTFAPRVVSKLPRLSLPRGARAAPPPVPDAPFSAVLPYDLPEGAEIPEQEEPGGDDPRGPILPVAVGAFLVSSALTLGRMPY